MSAVEAMVAHAIRILKDIESIPEDVFFDMSPNAKIGLECFELSGPSTNDEIVLTMPTRRARKSFVVVNSFSLERVSLIHRTRDATIPSFLASLLDEPNLQKVVHRAYVGKLLMTKISSSSSIAYRWIPMGTVSKVKMDAFLNDSAPFKELVDDFPVFPKGGCLSVGTWLFQVVSSSLPSYPSLHLRVLLFALFNTAHFYYSDKLPSAQFGLNALAMWLANPGCESCLIRTFLMLRKSNDAPYLLSQGDFFHEFIESPEVSMSFAVTELCLDRKNPIANSGNLKPSVLCVYGPHSLLVSSKANEVVTMTKKVEQLEMLEDDLSCVIFSENDFNSQWCS